MGELRIAVDDDGEAAHEGRGERDAARDARLARRGWTVIRVGRHDLANPRRLVDEVRAAFPRREVGR